MRQNPTKRYVITDVSPEDNETLIQQVNILRDIVQNYTIECSSIAYAKALIKNEFNAYIRYPISDWETLINFINIGVSDVYIDSALGFQIKKVFDLCHNKKIIIRVSPTVSPTAAIVGIRPNSFFIRPEDIQIYSQYIGVIDFKESDQEKEDTLFSIYKRGSFLYNLKDLLDDCTFSVQNPFIKPEFGQARLTCGQRCLIPGHSCHLCETQISLTNLVYDYFKNEEQEKKNNLQ